jgi:hypothetical protein
MSQRNNHRNASHATGLLAAAGALRGGGIASLGLILVLILLITSGGAG